MRGRSTIIAICVTCLGLAFPSAALAAYGAIAVDAKTGAYGLSFSYNTVGAAKKRARNECGKPGCRVLCQIGNGWCAVVETPTAYYGGFGRTRNLAFRDARQAAHNNRATRVASVFSGFG